MLQSALVNLNLALKPMDRARVGRLMLWLAVAEATAAGVVWAAGGAHTGWTRTRVERLEVDPVTGIEARHWEDRFVPGVDLLGIGMLGATVLAGVGWFLQRTTTTTRL